MLILQRKAGESIIIDNDIEITILEIGNEKIKIAIEAPKSIPIVRTELIEAADSNKEAASITRSALTALYNAYKKKKS